MRTDSRTAPFPGDPAPYVAYPPARRAALRAAALLLALLLAAVTLLQAPALAQSDGGPVVSVAVYPFEGPELLVGTAIADRATAALAAAAPDFELYGPLVAPLLLPPVPVFGGFLNPSTFLGSAPFSTPSGVELMQSGTGVDLAVGGTLRVADDTLELTLLLHDGTSLDRLALSAPSEEPERLATLVAAIVARRLGAPVPTAVAPFVLGDAYGDFVRAQVLIGAGFPLDARGVLEQSAEAGPLGPEGEQLLADLRAYEAGEAGGDPARMAAIALGADGFDEARARSYFEAFDRARSVPVATLWNAILAVSVNDFQGAASAFGAVADATYPYALLARAGFRLVNGLEGAGDDLAAIDARLADADRSLGVAATLGRALLAQSAGDLAAEESALLQLRALAPFLPYPFERLSFIAFDRDDPQAAAEALVVAVDLEPGSDLYWTNLGWAWYLLGFVERSEDASRRAIALDAGQFIARYNLGLALVVRGQLIEAMTEYDDAVRLDPEVDDEAVRDLENALERYPDEPAIHYALANLYETEGRRDEAATQYERYLERSARLELGAAARSRAAALREPPPPIEIGSGPELTLGAIPLQGAAHPGDTLRADFELLTPGRSLPTRVVASAILLAADGSEAARADSQVDVPEGAVGFVIDTLAFDLPTDLAPGEYTLSVLVTGPSDLRAEADLPLAVAGEPQPLRALLGRAIELQALGGDPLVLASDLERPELLVERLIDELRTTADAADEALPSVEGGRFEGLSGGELFRQSSPDDVRDFLDYLLADGARELSLTFVDAYAQWALDNAPTPDR